MAFYDYGTIYRSGLFPVPRYTRMRVKGRGAGGYGAHVRLSKDGDIVAYKGKKGGFTNFLGCVAEGGDGGAPTQLLADPVNKRIVRRGEGGKGGRAEGGDINREGQDGHTVSTVGSVAIGGGDTLNGSAGSGGPGQNIPEGIWHFGCAGGGEGGYFEKTYNRENGPKPGDIIPVIVGDGYTPGCLIIEIEE